MYAILIFDLNNYRSFFTFFQNFVRNGNEASTRDVVKDQVTGNTATSHDMDLYNTDFRMERNRLASFKNWPRGDVILPEPMAKAGFYYFGNTVALVDNYNDIA